MKRGVLLALFVVFLCVPSVFATDLGMNYYHESMMNSGGHYIYRNIAQVGDDFNDIKAIAKHVKVYMNPFIDGNLDWIIQLSGVAKQKGLKLAITMNVDDRLLTYENWDKYKYHVLAACSALSGKADMLLVGNEIRLHSPLTDQQIKDKIVPLIEECKQRFSGDVSYEEFWWAHEVWKGYNGLIMFNLYEDLDDYNNNVDYMKNNYKNFVVGEFGEDIFDGNNERDEKWQAYQVKERWSKLKSINVPVAYVFTYREPSQSGFGLLHGDGSKKLAWDALKGGDDGNGGSVNDLKISCSFGGKDCWLLEDSKGSECRSVRWGTDHGEIKVMACDKGNKFEIYRQVYPNYDFSACFEDACVDRDQGYSELKKDDDHDGNEIDITKLSFSATPNGKLLSDEHDGACRTVEYNTDVGWIQAKACEKTDHYEMYLSNYPTAANICVSNNCVGANGGFVSFT